jgi:hypothetical protein
MVARVQRHVGESEDRLLASGKDQHVIGLDVFIQRGDRLAQEGRPRRLCVAARQVLPQPPPSVRRRAPAAQPGKAPRRLTSRAGKGDRELAPGELALELESGRAHGPAGYGDGLVRPRLSV